MARDKQKIKANKKAKYQAKILTEEWNSAEAKAHRRLLSQNFGRTPKRRFWEQRKGASKRGIPFLLTFDEWWKIWQDSGHWEERGPTGYHMCRKFDVGPYSVDNVYIDHQSQNSKDSLKYRGLRLIFDSLCVKCKEKALCILLNS